MLTQSLGYRTTLTCQHHLLKTLLSKTPMILLIHIHFAKLTNVPLLSPVNTQTRSDLMKVQQIFTDRIEAPFQSLSSSHLPITTRANKSSMPADLPRVPKYHRKT